MIKFLLLNIIFLITFISQAQAPIGVNELVIQHTILPTDSVHQSIQHGRDVLQISNQYLKAFYLFEDSVCIAFVIIPADDIMEDALLKYYVGFAISNRDNQLVLLTNRRRIIMTRAYSSLYQRYIYLYFGA